MAARATADVQHSAGRFLQRGSFESGPSVRFGEVARRVTDRDQPVRALDDLERDARQRTAGLTLAQRLTEGVTYLGARPRSIHLIMMPDFARSAPGSNPALDRPVDRPIRRT